MLEAAATSVNDAAAAWCASDTDTARQDAEVRYSPRGVLAGAMMASISATVRGNRAVSSL